MWEGGAVSGNTTRDGVARVTPFRAMLLWLIAGACGGGLLIGWVAGDVLGLRWYYDALVCVAWGFAWCWFVLARWSKWSARRVSS